MVKTISEDQDEEERYTVTYTSAQICGLNGASVVLPCKYEYREAGDYDAGEWYEEKRGAVKEHRDYNYPDCSLEIQEVAEEHAGVYHFRFHTVQHQDWITEGSGMTLSVTALEIRMTPDKVTEGETVTLTCNTTCSLSNPTFTWYKNGQPLTSNHTTRDNTLLLKPVSSEDSGNYSCAVGGQDNLNSTIWILNVKSKESRGASLFLPVPAIIAIVIIPVVLLIFGAVCFRRRQDNAQEDPQHIYENGNIYQNVVRPRRETPQASKEFKVIRMRN
ncbi:sialic acid-binding Ig-like lectin 12 [Engraulis encrasicolus]|uniref:sialic acid-binding Ig-like lectin 12 n=1 Tax=Engraulis encrasicolus TaxID=184585 RepID=UPI002FD203E0